MNYLNTHQGQRLLQGYLGRFKGKSSLKVYRSEVKRFFDFFQGGLDDLNRAAFTKYRNHLDQSVNAKTIKRKFSILNQFFKYVEGAAKGFKSPIGINYGDMRTFQSRVYAESETFKTGLSHWFESLVCSGTKKTYGVHVRLFFVWVHKEPKDLKQADFISYKEHLMNERKLKTSTVWVKFIAINGFLKFMAAKNRKFKNPLSFNGLKLTPPKKDKGYYTVLTVKDANKLLRQPDKKSLIGKRDAAILRLMLTYGLRVNEVSKLKYEDMERERVKGQQKLWVRDRKGRIGRRPDTPIILNGKALAAFDDWLTNCRIRFAPDTPIFAGFIWDRHQHGLIINQTRLKAKKHLSVKALQNRVEKYVSLAKLDYGDRVISPHALRHTAFTLLVKAGVELIDLKKLAGHQDVSTTMIYLHSVQSYKDHVGMHNPLNK